MLLRVLTALGMVALTLGLGTPGTAEAVEGTGPPHVHFTAGDGTLPTGESFRFALGHRGDAAFEGWLFYQRPGWLEFKATRIISVWAQDADHAFVVGEGAFEGGPAVSFYMTVTGNQPQTGRPDHFRIVVMPGGGTPAAKADANLASGSIRVSKAMGLQVYWCGLLSGSGQTGEGAGVAAWVYHNGAPVNGVPIEVGVNYQRSGVRLFGHRAFTDQVGYAVTSEVLQEPLAQLNYALGVYWDNQWLVFQRTFGTNYRCGN